MTSISLTNIVFSYDGVNRILGGIDLDIAHGELFFLLGGSGCGKTTLLRIAAGFIAPSAGSVRFGTEDVTHLPAEKRGIGMVFQQYALWPHLNVGDNIGFGLEVQQVESSERLKRVAEALEQVNLSGFERRRIGELSGGQQQRVALARALVMKPRVLLLDEPLSNLDAHLRVKMRSEIRRVCKAAGVTAIYVTHDQPEALSTADRIAVLMGGQVAQVGTPRELYDRPCSAAVATFIGEANLLSGKISSHDTVEIFCGRIPAVVPAGLPNGSAVTMCLRPERVRCDETGVSMCSGIIEQASYVGSGAQWTVRVGDTRLSVYESAPPLRQVGDTITMSVRVGDVVVMPS